ncbi:(-)-germacrene D synthase-like [Argentina anserina]|uniref:(-)-germacrene D synthase-like n=1 Tax=Argentina anserina TaxID=57926 RepID=UPI00217641D7|nr:(-)-germacrene D synthase-like [Potentilla anserina]
MSFPVLASDAQMPRVDVKVRQSSNFTRGILSDQFMSYASVEKDTKIESRVQELKKEVNKMLMAPEESIHGKMSLIDDITRLGVPHHFQGEINEILQTIHKNPCHGTDLQYDEDLHFTSLRFRLLRQQGYNISCDVFNKFKNGDGKFKESLAKDVVGLLSLYEAAQLMMHGEDILEEALAFATTHLESALNHLSSVLLKQVSHALCQPFWKGLPRVEAVHYISIYGDIDSHNSTLLTLAKLDFNLLQKVHQNELNKIARWWKDLDLLNKLPFARDRMVESYFWASAVYFEPEYHLARNIVCKFVAIITMVDDIYDVYGTYEELELFTEAIERWDISAVDQLPGYMRVCYEALLNTYSEIEENMCTEIEEQLPNKGNLSRVHYAREAFKIQIRAYIQEAKWFKKKYTPRMEEYMKVECDTSFLPFAVTSFYALGEIASVTNDTMDWVLSDPKIVKAASVIGRLLNDIVGHKFEHEREHIASSVECYMNQYGVTEEKAKIELMKQVSDAWKDINGEWLQPSASIPKPLLWFIVNLARSAEVLYKNVDVFTHSKTVLQGYLVSLYIEPLAV